MSTTYFGTKELLDPPIERAAFSDRQAYVCAELAKLAYFKFEGGNTLDQALTIVQKLVPNDARRELLEAQLRSLLTDSPTAAAKSKQAMAEILAAAGFVLKDTFNREGTQAFFCTRQLTLGGGGEKTIGFLVFRGTEPKDFRDIIADVRARLETVVLGSESVELHTGYYAAFQTVRPEIEKALAEHPHDQLFLAGHSLGGALAIVATRILAPSGSGACYTFGAPPVGTEDVQNGLKTPVYEIINEIDIVPRLPNPWATGLVRLLLRLLRLVLKSFTFTAGLLASSTLDERLEAFIDMMTRYRHPGYVSYLVGSGNEARLRYNVDAFDRLGWWLNMIRKRRFGQYREVVADHSIDAYIEKLVSSGMKRL